MPTPRLRSISGGNFGSLVAPFHIDLPENGLVHLDGKNHDTGGSSASGKSTLIRAINLPFGTCDAPLTEMQTWYSDSAPLVCGVYDVGDKHVEVSVGKKFGLKINGEDQPGGTPQKKETLDKIFGMGAEMRGALTYRGQRQPGLFLSKGDADKKEFLTKLLGLDVFEQAQEKGSAKVKDLEQQLATLAARRADIAAQQQGLGSDDELPAATARSTALRTQIEFDQVAVKTLAEEIVAMEARGRQEFQAVLNANAPERRKLEQRREALAAMIARPVTPSSPELDKLRGLVTECQARYDRLLSEDGARRRALEGKNHQLLQLLSKHQISAAGAPGFRATRLRVAADMEVLAANVCPTCQREWEQATDKRQELEAELEAVDEQLASCQAHLNACVDVKAELQAQPAFEQNPMVATMLTAVMDGRARIGQERQRLESARSVVVAESMQAVAEAEAELVSFDAKTQRAAAAARDAATAGIDAVRELIGIARARVSTQQGEYGAAQRELGRLTELRKQRRHLQGVLDEMDPRVALAEATLFAERDFLHLIGRDGFLGSIFDEVLAEISEETNQTLASIANTRNCTLQFVSENLTQKGAVRREISPVITINGHRAGIKYGPSGGMLSAIELAVDLAVGAVISRRTGVCPGWLILDESFDGLGPVEKETCLEILQKYSRDRLVLLVDHTSEVQGLFTKKVTVECREGLSTIA